MLSNSGVFGRKVVSARENGKDFRKLIKQLT